MNILKKIDKKKAGILLGCIAALVLIPYGCNRYFCWHYEKQAKPLIDYVEQYRKATGKLPRDAKELGYDISELNSGPYYMYVDSTRYTVYYADSYDRYYTYDSSTGKWTSTSL